MAISQRRGGGSGVTVFPFFFIVQQQSAALVQRLGKFVRVAAPGLHVKIPFVEKVAGSVNLRVQQLDVKVPPPEAPASPIVPQFAPWRATCAEPLRDSRSNWTLTPVGRLYEAARSSWP